MRRFLSQFDQTCREVRVMRLTFRKRHKGFLPIVLAAKYSDQIGPLLRTFRPTGSQGLGEPKKW